MRKKMRRRWERYEDSNLEYDMHQEFFIMKTLHAHRESVMHRTQIRYNANG